ncbi:MAG: hypothetical protein ABR606_18215 [Vicinamibacterales bacterium]
MNIDETIKLIDAVAKLLAALAWPAVVVFILVRFGSSLRESIPDRGRSH